MGKGTCVWLMTAKSDWRGEAVCAPKSSSRWVIANGCCQREVLLLHVLIEVESVSLTLDARNAFQRTMRSFTRHCPSVSSKYLRATIMSWVGEGSVHAFSRQRWSWDPFWLVGKRRSVGCSL